MFQTTAQKKAVVGFRLHSCHLPEAERAPAAAHRTRLVCLQLFARAGVGVRGVTPQFPKDTAKGADSH